MSIRIIVVVLAIMALGLAMFLLTSCAGEPNWPLRDPSSVAGFNPPGGWAWQYNNAHTVVILTP